jgi:hypothetical protein
MASNDVTKHYKMNDRFTAVGDKNVWVEFTALARDYNAVNLGQVAMKFQRIIDLRKKIIFIFLFFSFF